jgi:hypothetical protein
VDPLILDSARKHGVDDEDIVHAYRNAIRVYDLSEELTMLVGPNRTGHDLIEVGVVDSTEGSVIVHAMTARPKFLR